MDRTFATQTLDHDAVSIARAATLIRQGLPVAVATETVYGLAGDATSGEAVARIYDAKGRPAFNPLIVHVATLAEAETIAFFSPAARALAERFWPGPLTMVLPGAAGSPIASLVTAGLPTVAVRMADHPAMRDLIRACGVPLAAPSANASGTLSPTRAGHVARSLGGRIPLIIDAGATELGLESTIVAVEQSGLRLLRPGPILPEQLTEACGYSFLATLSGPIEAPGQLASHYAPALALRLDAASPAPGEWLIGFGDIAGDDSLSPRGDPFEAAARLFDALHIADGSGRRAIAVAPIPDHGIGAAINDRLRRAAAPR